MRILQLQASLCVLFTLLAASESRRTSTGSALPGDDGNRGRNGRKNVLLIIVDDLRPEINAYGGMEENSPPSLFPRMHTPNLDRLASQSLLLQRAYVQQAVCGPSRASMLTARRPDTTRVYDLDGNFRVLGGNFTTLPQYFKQNGYVTRGLGKVFHLSKAAGGNDDDHSWSTPSYIPKESMRHWIQRSESWKAVTNEMTARMPLHDSLVAEKAVQQLRPFSGTRKLSRKNFFMAVGFSKPHLPLVFPEEFLDMYPEEEIMLPSNPYAPYEMPRMAWSSWSELRAYRDIRRLNVDGLRNSTLPDSQTKALRRAYYSAVSYVDSLVGDVLDGLESLGLERDTVVALWGDHGYLLGEHGGWCKHNNFELATHVPLMLKIPGLTDDGLTSSALVESVDIYPTLVEAAGLRQIPVCPRESNQFATCREGTSFMRLIDQSSNINWKSFAFSQYPRRNGNFMGYTLRSDRFRYTQWVGFNKATAQPDWDHVVGEELYDHNIDPDENRNAADDAQYAQVNRELSTALRNGWRSNMADL